MTPTSRYDAAAEVAAHIVNVIQTDRPKAELFGLVLALILDAIANSQPSLEPSEN